MTTWTNHSPQHAVTLQLSHRPFVTSAEFGDTEGKKVGEREKIVYGNLLWQSNNFTGIQWTVVPPGWHFLRASNCPSALQMFRTVSPFIYRALCNHNVGLSPVCPGFMGSWWGVYQDSAAQTRGSAEAHRDKEWRTVIKLYQWEKWQRKKKNKKKRHESQFETMASYAGMFAFTPHKEKKRQAKLCNLWGSCQMFKSSEKQSKMFLCT